MRLVGYENKEYMIKQTRGSYNTSKRIKERRRKQFRRLDAWTKTFVRIIGCVRGYKNVVIRYGNGIKPEIDFDFDIDVETTTDGKEGKEK